MAPHIRNCGTYPWDRLNSWVCSGTNMDAMLKLKLKLKLVSQSVSQSVALSVLVSGTHLTHLGPMTSFSSSLKFPLDSCGFVIL
jgi:hypothetical protein